MYMLSQVSYTTTYLDFFKHIQFIVHLYIQTPFLDFNHQQILLPFSIHSFHNTFKKKSISAFKQNSLHIKMAIRQMLRRSLSNERRSIEVPKGHLAVYVGENEKKRFVIPLSYLNHPLFQDLLCQAEEEFGFHHPMGGLTIPCNEDRFVDLTSRLSRT
ncbi:hypothetical protein ABFS83_02G013600 [Erythranthe nasuta]